MGVECTVERAARCPILCPSGRVLTLCDITMQLSPVTHGPLYEIEHHVGKLDLVLPQLA